MAETSATVVPRRLGHALFRQNDEFAWRLGWQTRAGRLGLNRAYRCSSFKLPVRWRGCCGMRRFWDVDCGNCAGTGRVTLGLSSGDGRR
jgi:hypothetical protein